MDTEMNTNVNMDNGMNCTCCRDSEKYVYDIPLPGVGRNSIGLRASDSHFCVSVDGKKEMDTCYSLNHEINVEKIKAKYHDGLLKISLPLKHPIETKNIPVS